MDDARVILKVGAAGGSVTLLGRPMENGEWQFVRRAIDQTGDLLGGTDAKQRSDSPGLEWVDSWSEALGLMDRYPWARLHPLVVHWEFVEPLRTAVAERLALISDGRERELAREKWERVISAAEFKTQ